MKKILFVLLTLMTVCINVNAQNFKCDGTTYSSTGRQKSNSTPVATGFTWTDSKNNSYPIYISNSGSCYIIKTSSKTGKEYKNYLGSEISQDICKKLGKEYKGKNKLNEKE